MSEKYRRRIYQILTIAVVCFCCVRAQTLNETEKRVDRPAEAGQREEVQNSEDSGIGETESRNSSILPDNDAVRESLCSYYHRDDCGEISEEELAAAKGRLSPYSLTIHSGEEFALMREWYDWDNLESYWSACVVFSEDLEEWPEEELEALSILKCNIYVESSGKTIPARALSYLTGATYLNFSEESDITDVSGTLSEGKSFPSQIKGVSLDAYREGKYKTLLRLLQDSQVETIWVDSQVEMDSRNLDGVTGKLQGFWLDDVAGISTLREVILLNGTAIRVRNEKALEGSKVKRCLGYVDQKTDFGFAGHLPALEELKCDVMEECELQPLLDREGFSLELHFFEDCPAFYQAVSWPEDESGERTPHSYQRIYDQDRMAECFTGWSDSEKESWTRWYIAVGNNNPCLRITDGAEVYEIRPVEDESSRNHTNPTEFMYVGEGGLGFLDINFDGTKDLVLGAERYGVAGPTRTGFAYLWNPGTGRYEFCPSYRSIDNPEVDEEQQMIRSKFEYWPDDFHRWAIYRYTDGAFTTQSVLTQETLEADEIPGELAVPEGSGVIHWQEEVFENGEVAEEKNVYAVQIEGEETVFPQTCQSYYEEDSYWAGYDPDIWEEKGKRYTRTNRDTQELAAAKEKLWPYDLTIQSGEEFARIREWYDWDTLSDADYVRVVFSEDLAEWPTKDLEALSILKGTVYVESKGETFPVRALTYLTGAREVIFSDDSDLTDVSGTLPVGRNIPQQLKTVTLDLYREGKYRTLLRLLQDSQVETVRVMSDRNAKNVQGFWLDDVAGFPALKEVVLEETAIRVREETALEHCSVERIEGYADSGTDLQPLFDRDGLFLYLYFYRDEDASAPEEGTTCIYQRGYDQDRMVECFTQWQGNDDRMCDPWLRVTDGPRVYELRPEVSEMFGPGDYREDRMALKDINFDGVKDITLETGHYGNQGIVYEYGWILNQGTGRYEYSPTYRDIGNPSVDARYKLVRSCWRNAAYSHSWAVYRYVDGAFVEQSELTEEFILKDEVQEELGLPEGAGVTHWQERIFENEEVVEVKDAYQVRIAEKRSELPKVCEAYYAQDSYWASTGAGQEE